MRPLILIPQSEIYQEIEEAINPSGAANLWNKRQIYRGINAGLRTWANRVQFPRLYSLADGVEQGVFAYDLPSYIRGDIQVRVQTTIYGFPHGPFQTDDTATWLDIPAGAIDPTDSKGSAEFRFHMYPYSEAAQIIWWAENGPVPLTMPTLSTSMDADDTSLVLGAVPQIADVGYVKIGSELIAYAGMSSTATTITLQNLERGLLGTTAASHSSGDTVEWCVAIDDHRLLEYLRLYAIWHLHMLPLHRGTSEDRANHEKMMNYAKMQAEGFWRTSGYVPQRGMRFVLHQRALGGRTWK